MPSFKDLQIKISMRSLDSNINQINRKEKIDSETQERIEKIDSEPQKRIRKIDLTWHMNRIHSEDEINLKKLIEPKWKFSINSAEKKKRKIQINTQKCKFKLKLMNFNMPMCSIHSGDEYWNRGYEIFNGMLINLKIVDNILVFGQEIIYHE